MVTISKSSFFLNKIPSFENSTNDKRYSFKFGKIINDGIENAKFNRKDLSQLLSNAGDSATTKVQKLKQFNALSSADKTKLLNERINAKLSDQIRHARTEVIYRRRQCQSNKFNEKI